MERTHTTGMETMSLLVRAVSDPALDDSSCLVAYVVPYQLLCVPRCDLDHGQRHSSLTEKSRDHQLSH